MNLHNIGDAHFRLGELSHAYAAFEQSRDLAKEFGWERGVVMNEVYLAWLRGLRGEAVAADLERAGRQAAKLGDREMAVQARWFLARLFVQRHDPAGDRLLRAAEAEARAAGLESMARRIAADARVGLAER